MSRTVEHLSAFEAEAEEMIETLAHLASFDSPSADSARIEAFQRAYAALLEEAGAASELIPGPRGPHLHARFEGDARRGAGVKNLAADRAPIVLVGHADTIWPAGEAARRPPARRGAFLLGPGVYDMRAGLVLALFTLRRLRAIGAPLGRPVRLFLSADEELGSATAHPHMERLYAPESVAIVLEPPLEDGAIKGWRKGVGMYTLHVQGIEAHAGLEPERGASAVHAIARLVLEVLSWAEPERGVTVNIGQLEGGIATNVVAGSASAGIDLRFQDAADGARLDTRLRALRSPDLRTSIQLEGGIIFPPLEPCARSRALHALVRTVGAELGLDIGVGRAGGGSDGSFLASRGLAVLDGMGVEGAGAHSPEERVEVAKLPVRAAILTSVIERIASSQA